MAKKKAVKRAKKQSATKRKQAPKKKKKAAKKAKKKAPKKKAAKKQAPKKKAATKKPVAKKKKKIAKKKPAAKKKVPAKKKAPAAKRVSAKDRLATLESANRKLHKQLKTMQARLDEATGTSPDLSAVLNVLSPRMDELHLSQSELRTRQDNLRDHHNHAESRFREWQEGVEAMVARLARTVAKIGSPDDVAVPAATIEGATPAAAPPAPETTRRPSGGTGHARYDELERRIDELLADADRVKAQIHGFAELQRMLSEIKGETQVSKQAFQKFLEQSQRTLESELKALVELRSTQTHELVKRVRDRAQKGIEQFEAFLKKAVKNAKKR
ncbi:MAG: hypothetical protein ACYTGX_16000 [Planctomycetota bacterium]